MAVQLDSVSTGIGSKPCLLVVDAIKGFTDPSSPLGSDFAKEIAVISSLMVHANSRSWPCYLSTVVYRTSTDASVFRTKIPALNVLTPESCWIQLDPRLPDLKTSTVIEKTHASMFFGTELGHCLKAKEIDTVIITGFTTSGCVRASAVDALQWNFRVAVVKDAVGDRDEEAHAANLFDLGAKYADVIGSSEILRV